MAIKVASLVLVSHLLSCLLVHGEGVARLDAGEILGRYQESNSWLQCVSMNVRVVYRADGIDGYGVNDFVYWRRGETIEWEGDSMWMKGESVVDMYSKTIETVMGLEDFPEKVLVVNGPLTSSGPPWSVWIKSDYEDVRETMHADQDFAGNLDGYMFGSSHRSVPDLLAEGELHLHDDQETIDGERCYVLEATTKYGTVKAWIAPGKGYHALKYAIDKKKDDLFDETPFGALGEPGKKGVRWTALLHSAQVERVGDVFVPVAGELSYTSYLEDGEKHVQRYTVERNDIDLNPDFEALGAFVLGVPNGTRVLRDDFPGISWEWQDGKVVPSVSASDVDVIDKQISQLRDKEVKPTEKGPIAGASLNREVVSAEPRSASKVLRFLILPVVGLVVVVAGFFLVRFRWTRQL